MIKRYSLLLLLCAQMVMAQEQSSVSKRLRSLISYTDAKVSEDSLSTWIDWVALAEDVSKSVPDRNKAWNDFLLSFYRHMGSIPNRNVNPQLLSGWSQFLTFPFLYGRIFDLEEHQKPKAEPTLISYSGSGQESMLLIPPLGFSNAVYEVFKDRYQDDFRFTELSYPQGTKGFSFPKKAAYHQAAWLNRIKTKLVQEFQSQRGPTWITAVGSGLFTAIQIAQEYPDQVKGIISIDGTYASRLIDPSTNKLADKDYRKTVSDRAFPLSLVIQFSPLPVSGNYAFSLDPALNQKYLDEITPESINTLFRYNQEMRAQDLTQEFDHFKTPILSLISVHDDLSPLGSILSAARDWKSLELRYPDHSISTVKIGNSRTLMFIDQPIAFDFYLKQFIANPENEVQVPPTVNLPTTERPSPKAAISQVIAATELKLAYSRPAVNGRKIFGELVPHDQVWRSGANEATTFETSHDVLIEDQLLKAGRYSLFVIPKEEEAWEIIFNRIPDQWGAFNYNPQFDALRVKIDPQSLDEQQEYLKYEFEDFERDQVELTLSWENTQIRLAIKEYFQMPFPPQRAYSWNWEELLTDQEGDGANPGMTDGKALSYVQRGDSLWFKFDLHSYNNKKAFALNLLIDSDNDQSTGAPWFGQNTAFVFDIALTLWMQKSGSSFQGLHGRMSPADFSSGTTDLAISNNMTYYLDPARKTYMIRVHKDDIGAKGNTIRLIGAVGEFRTWNDDIGDQTSATLKLK